MPAARRLVPSYSAREKAYVPIPTSHTGKRSLFIRKSCLLLESHHTTFMPAASMDTYYRIWFAKFSIKLNIKFVSIYVVFWAWHGNQNIQKYSTIFQNHTERYHPSTKQSIKFELAYICGILRLKRLSKFEIFQDITERYFLSTKLNIQCESINVVFWEWNGNENIPD